MVRDLRDEREVCDGWVCDGREREQCGGTGGASGDPVWEVGGGEAGGCGEGARGGRGVQVEGGDDGGERGEGEVAGE